MSRRGSSSAFLSLVLGVLFIAPLVVQIGYTIYWSYDFDRKCGDWLKMAADANSIQIASERLDKALVYIDEHGLTKGSTAVFFEKPSNDLEPWYTNLKKAQENLHDFPKGPNITEADISTALVKLRETLLDHEQHGDSVTCPSGISLYPYQVRWFWLWFGTVILALIGVFTLVNEFAP